MAKPTIDQPNWGVTLNDHLDSMASDIDARETPAGAQAKADAAQAAAVAQVAADVDDTGTDVGAAINTTYGTMVPITRLGAATSNTPSQNRTAIQAGIDAGYHLYVPPGIFMVNQLVAKAGMRITGAGKGNPDGTSPISMLRSDNGVLFSTPGTGHCNYAMFENLDLQGIGASAGSVITGMWAATHFSNVRIRQYNTAALCIDATGWIDVVVDGASEIMGTTTHTEPLVRLVSDSANIAQFAFRDVRVTGGSAAPAFWFEAPAGCIQNFELSGVNFEIPNGGAVKMLSCRNVRIANCGVWDTTVAQANDLFYIGKTASGRTSGQIIIENLMRDASTAPAAGVQDIKAESTTFDLNIINCGHQTGAAFNVDAGGASGSLRGSMVTLTNGQNMTTRRITYGTAIPTAGTYQAGDLHLRTNPAYGTMIGWVCLSPGTPGSWGLIDARPVVAEGQVVLAAGTATVTGLASLTNGSLIEVFTAGKGTGTMGALYVSSKTAGTGFTIKSTEATDDQTVQYVIRKY